MVTNTHIHVQTKGDCELIDITRQVAEKVGESGVKDL